MAQVASAVPDEQVPLDTIPVSPDGGMTDATNDKAAAHDSGKIITVFDDPANFNVKHALQNTWTLWFTKPPSGKQDWSELLKEVISFDSVEEFWGIYVRLPSFPLSFLPARTCLRLPLPPRAPASHHPFPPADSL